MPLTDPNDLGRRFATLVKASGHEQTLCDIATDASKTRHLSSLINESKSAALEAEDHIFGFWNDVHRLRMPDNSIWIARIRNPLSSKSVIADDEVRKCHDGLLFENEIATMCFVREKTSIRVPEVYAHNASWDNKLGVPYMLIEYIHGRIPDMSFNETLEISEEDMKVHQQLASFVFELLQHPFERIGQLRQDDHGDFVVDTIVDRGDRLFEARRMQRPTTTLVRR